MTERLLTVDGLDASSPFQWCYLRWGTHDGAPLPSDVADSIAAELDRLYAAAEANQAPGPAWKAKLREEVEAHLGQDAPAGGGYDRGVWDMGRWVLELIDALPDPPTPDPDAPPVYVPPEGHVAPVLGKDVPDGWEGRFGSEAVTWHSAEALRETWPHSLFEVRRVPAPEPATEWVPLTKLVGRTLPHGPSCDPNPPVAKVSSGYDGWFWHADADSDVRTTIMGIREDGMVEVLAEGER